LLPLNSGVSERKTKEDSPIVGGIVTGSYIAHAQARAKRRKSLWNLILIPLVVIGVVCASIGLFGLLWHLSVWIHPENAGRLREVMGGGQQQFPQFLVTLPCLFAGIPLVGSGTLLGF
jgi:hypothetical protein